MKTHPAALAATRAIPSNSRPSSARTRRSCWRTALRGRRPAADRQPRRPGRRPGGRRGEGVRQPYERGQTDKAVDDYLVPRADTAGVRLGHGADPDPGRRRRRRLQPNRVRLLSDARLELLDPSYTYQQAGHPLRRAVLRARDGPGSGRSDEQDEVAVDVAAGRATR